MTVMKSKILFVTALFLIIGNIANAQTDTLNVYLEKNKEYKFGVDLVFELANEIFGFYPKFVNYDFMREDNNYAPRFYAPYLSQ